MPRKAPITKYAASTKETLPNDFRPTDVHRKVVKEILA
jgi:hypothetical protein